jgi:hypothetical protein
VELPHEAVRTELLLVGGRVTANPSLERTSTGLAREAPVVHHPPRGPIRFRPAQLKR